MPAALWVLLLFTSYGHVTEVQGFSYESSCSLAAIIINQSKQASAVCIEKR